MPFNGGVTEGLVLGEQFLCVVLPHRAVAGSEDGQDDLRPEGLGDGQEAGPATADLPESFIH